jgi:hypothetical protein
MKKLLVCLVVLAFLLVPAMAMAHNPGNELSDDAVEVEHWEWNGTAWIHKDPNDTSSLARCWRSGQSDGTCNKEVWDIPFTNHASMAQWLFYNLGGTRWDWRILKPGTYAADCIEATIRSNNDVAVTFAGFGDLEYMEEGGIDRTISTWYSWGESLAVAERNGWVRAADLNQQTAFISDSEQLHRGFVLKLWNKIDVVNCNSSCEYENTGTIYITLQNIKLWVDGESGHWLDLLEDEGAV